jgi:hypothetical protein
VKRSLLLAIVLIAPACTTPEGGVANKVLTDFGIRERPEDYVSRSDAIKQKLNEVGNVEIKRLNREGQNGTLKLEESGFTLRYYREVKVYEQYYPMEVRAISKSARGAQGYNATIEYRYRLFESTRKDSRAEALTALANIPSETQGRESYRYRFSQGGAWDGAKGKKGRR